MAVLDSLLSTFRRSRKQARRPQREFRHNTLAESLEQRLLLTNPDILESNPGAAITIYLDFDGHTETAAAWTSIAINNQPVASPAFSLDADLNNFSNAERQTIEEIFFRVSEDFAPFSNVNVTTVEPPVFNHGESILVSVGGGGLRTEGSQSWTARSYNHALLNGFTNTNSSNTVFVFPRDYTSHPQTLPSGRAGELGRDVANGISEAVGIAMGLTERTSEGTLEASYLVGNGTFALGERDVWTNAANQDDLAILTDTNTNGLEYVADDHGNTVSTASALTTISGPQSISGMISENNDVDLFTFSTGDTTATFTVQGMDLTQRNSTLFGNPFTDLGVTNPGANLDPVLRLLDANGNELDISDPPFSSPTNNGLAPSISVTLPAGQYYLEVSNRGEYGNLGEYTVTLNGVDSPAALSVPPLQSNPGAAITLFLDFNGHIVANAEVTDQRTDGISRSFYVPAYDTDNDRTTFSAQEEEQIAEIWARVAEDFSPFNVNVTTFDPFIYNNQQGLLVAIGGDGSWGPAGVGFAELGTFSTGFGDNNAVVYSDNFSSPKETALETSAIIANALGVESHLEFNNGTPTGNRNPGANQPAVGPIGGEAVNTLRDIFQQLDGETPGNPLDPIALITSPANTIQFRRDDHGNDTTTAQVINVTPSDEILTGVIETINDEDWFSFRTKPTALATISVTGLDLTVDSLGNPIPSITNPGANLDPVLELYRDINGTPALVAIDGQFTFNNSDINPATLKASVATPLQAGLYYIKISNRQEYGNIGQYTVTMEGVDSPPAVLTFSPTSIAENAGLVTGIGRIDRPFGQPTTSPLVVNLHSTDSTELQVPGQVTIPPGQSFVNFDVTAVDDALLDGDQNVVVEASVLGELNSTAILKVTDYETITATVSPNPVREDAGPAGVALTVTRSNSDIGAANHWVSYDDIIELRDPSGAVVIDTNGDYVTPGNPVQLQVEWPSGVRPSVEIVHDVQTLQDGSIAVFNGTGTAFLSVYNVTTRTWRHYSQPGLSANTVLDPTIGGLTSIDDYVFLTDLESFDGDPRGIVRINVVTGQVDRFADNAIGSRLFVLDNTTTIQEIHPVTGDIVNTLFPTNTLGISNNLEALAFDGNNLWVLFDDAFGNSINELQKINPDTGEILEVHSVPIPNTQFGFSGDIGMTEMNGLIYFNLPFDTSLSVFSRSIQAYDPSTRQLVGGLLPIEALNNISIGTDLGSIPTADRLIVHGDPDQFFGGFFGDRVYEIDPTTGRVRSSFPTGVNFFVNGGGISSVSDVVIDGTVHDEVIYLNLGFGEGIYLFDRNGTRIDADPTTVPFDAVPHDGFFSYDKISGADVPGITAQELSFRDLSIDITDGMLYGLAEDGSEISVYDPETLVFDRRIILDAVVNTLSVDEDGNILAGGPNGTIRIFDPNGTTIAVLDTTSVGLGSVADVETNISERVIISDINGVVLTGPREAVYMDDISQFQVDSASAGTVSFVSFGRHTSLPTGPLIVSLSSSDLTEIQTPVEVTIPVGQTSATVFLDVIDDNLLDGSQAVTITGDALNYEPDATIVTVLDAETVGVEIMLDSTITIHDANLIADGDLISITLNNHKTVFEIDDTSAANGIAPTSHYPVSIDLSSLPSEDAVAAAIATAINLSGLGASANSSGPLVTITGNPYFPSVQVTLNDPTAATALKPIAETAGLQSGVIRIYRSDVDGPFTVPASTTGTMSVPTAITDNDNTLSQIEIVEQVSRITDVNVTLSLQHTFLPDLDITLVSPSGTRVPLFTDLRSNESLMTNTVFDDEAATRIVDGTAPFTGSFIPKVPLSSFDGENPSGTWTLEVVDDNITDTGTLISWSLQIQTLGIAETRVTLISTDTTEATVTSQEVVIPAARSEVFVDLTAIDDTIVDGTIPVTIQVDSLNVAGLDPGSDMIDVTDVENLSISLDALTVSEGAGAGALTGTVTRTDTDQTLPLLVNLSSSDTSELAVPSTVTIPAGESSVSFPVDAVDDLFFDGDQLVTISATAAGYFSGDSPVITVSDQEPRLVLSTLTPSIAEDTGTITISLSRLDVSDLSQPQNVLLTSSDLSELEVPASFTIGIGQVSTTFTATVKEDSLLDGPQVVTISALDPNPATRTINDGTLDITVEDAEFLSVTVPAGEDSFLENAGSGVTTGTVSISSVGHTAPIVVTLTNSDPSEISIPLQVTIPVGESTATFPIDAVNDISIDRNQLVAVTASAAGYRDGVLNLTVRDHEPPIAKGPVGITEDPTPTIHWAPVKDATRYDLWVNDVSRNISQLFRLDSLAPSAPLFSDDFEAEHLDQNNNRTFDPALWDSSASSGAENDSLSLNDPTGSYSAHFNGSPDGGDVLQSVAIDLSGQVGAQIRFSYQRTGQGDTPDTGQDLIVSWRDSDNVWHELGRELGDGTDMIGFQYVVFDLPQQALHSNFAFRLTSVGQTVQMDVEGVYDDWFVDSVEVVGHQTFTPTQELGVGRYRYWVRAYDDLEQPGFWSSSFNFQIRTRPEIISPTSGSIVAASTFPEISWTSVVDTDRYDLWVNNVTTGQSQVIRQTNLQTTSYASTLANLPGGTYTAWARAIAVDGLAGYWSRPQTFTVLSTPTNIRPSGATFDRTPRIEWDAVEGATNYYVWVTQRNPGETPVVVLRDRFVTNTFKTPETDLEDGRYAVWVKAIAADGTESNWSPAVEFTIGGRPQLTAPADEGTTSTNPVFLWTGIDGAARYELWVNRVDVVQNRIIHEQNLQVTSFTSPTSLVPGQYRVWVRALSEMGEASFWSSPVDFTVVSANVPAVPNADAQSMFTAATMVNDTLAPMEHEWTGGTYVAAHVVDQATEVISIRVHSPDPDNGLVNPSVEASAEETEGALDEVLAQWDAAEWWSERTTDDTAAQSGTERLAALGLGLLSTGRISRAGNRRKRNETH